jgi:hypothetical protein
VCGRRGPVEWRQERAAFGVTADVERGDDACPADAIDSPLAIADPNGRTGRERSIWHGLPPPAARSTDENAYARASIARDALCGRSI